jgi:glucose-1-phosphate adenylyltransferase
MPQRHTAAIILGGGRGTRLQPLTRERAKPAVPLAGKYRLIDIPISNCINSDINRIFILTQFLSASLHRHVYDTYKFDGFSGGFIELLPAEQTLTHNDWYQGTADAVRRQLQEIRNASAETVIILAGDHLYRMNYRLLISYHQDTRADITISSIRVPQHECHRFGIMKTTENGKILDYFEKPSDHRLLQKLAASDDNAKPFVASMGIYAFKMNVLEELLEQTTGKDFGNEIIPQNINRFTMYAYPFDGYWEDIGTIKAFFDANIALTQPDPPFNFYERNHPIFTRSRFLPPSRVQTCTIENSILAEGSRLRQAFIENSIIGLRGVVRDNSRLHSVVMMGADYYEMQDDFEQNYRLGIPHLGIGNRCVIERAIIDKNARIGDDVIIHDQHGKPDAEYGFCVVKDGITVIPKHSVICSGTVL